MLVHQRQLHIMLCHHRHYIDRTWSLDTVNKCSKRSLIASVRLACFHTITPLNGSCLLYEVSIYKAVGNIFWLPRLLVSVFGSSKHYTYMVYNQKIPDILHYICTVYNLYSRYQIFCAATLAISILRQLPCSLFPFTASALCFMQHSAIFSKLLCSLIPLVFTFPCTTALPVLHVQ
jgi:hypothetical protein